MIEDILKEANFVVLNASVPEEIYTNTTITIEPYDDIIVSLENTY